MNHKKKKQPRWLRSPTPHHNSAGLPPAYSQSYGGANMVPKPQKERMKPLIKSVGRREMEDGVKNMIEQIKDLPKVDATVDDEYDEDKFRETVVQLSSLADLMDQFYDYYYEYLKTGLMKYKLSMPPSNVELGKADEDIDTDNDTIDAKFELENLKDAAQDAKDSNEKLKYLLDSIKFYFGKKDAENYEPPF